MWEKAFGEQRIHYLVQDDIITDPQEVLNGVFAFLEIQPMTFEHSISEAVNKSTIPRFPKIALLASLLANWMRKNRFIL